jgi:UDP:flavonoid glycosyltransferase YjiC (YdhE family)
VTNLRDYYLQSTIHRVSLLYLGLNSVGEAVYAHVPMIILPDFADQPAMAAKVMKAKIGYAIERDLLATEQLVFYIEIILQDYDSFVQRLI